VERDGWGTILRVPKYARIGARAQSEKLAFGSVRRPAATIRCPSRIVSNPVATPE
jgi:hypothetical protein